jgi:mannosyl-3-phosphoglycerate phosphatase family protein
MKDMVAASQPVIFTDLDGTLLDEAYSFEPALPALDMIRQRNIPLIISSSKTRREIEFYRNKLGNCDPFVSENGGGIFIPRGYFGNRRARASDDCMPYEKIVLGASYADLRKAVEDLRNEGFNVKGFGDMTEEEVAQVAKMDVSEARLAVEREFDEPFLFHEGVRKKEELLQTISGMGFHHTEGRFLHIIGDSDKGKAVDILREFYEAERGRIYVIALGNSLNDYEMLARADRGIVVQKPDGTYDPHLEKASFLRAEGIGPEGWRNAISGILSAFPPAER